MATTLSDEVSGLQIETTHKYEQPICDRVLQIQDEAEQARFVFRTEPEEPPRELAWYHRPPRHMPRGSLFL